MAVTLAVFIAREIIQYPGTIGMRMILRGSLIAAVFVLMAIMMISYLVGKLREKKHD
jgi:hypothetical protein